MLYLRSVRAAATAERGPFSRGFYLRLPMLGCSMLLMQFVSAHECERRKQPPHHRAVSWRYEFQGPAGDGEDLRRAHCSFTIGGHRWLHIGPWRSSDKTAQNHCSAMVLELFQVDPYVYGGKRGRSFMSCMEEDNDQLWICLQDINNRLVKRFKNHARALGGREPAEVDPSSLVEWIFEQQQGSHVLFKATSRVPLLAQEGNAGGACRWQFEGEWMLGKNAAQHNACLSLQAYLDQLDESEKTGRKGIRLINIPVQRKGMPTAPEDCQ